MKKRILLICAFAAAALGLLLFFLLQNGNPYNKLFSSMRLSDVERIGILSNRRPLREAELDPTDMEQLIAVLNRLELPPSDTAQTDYSHWTGAHPISFQLHIRLKDGTDLLLVPMEYSLTARRTDRYYLIYPEIESYSPNNAVPERFGESKLYRADEDPAFPELFSLLASLHEKYWPEP